MFRLRRINPEGNGFHRQVSFRRLPGIGHLFCLQRGSRIKIALRQQQRPRLLGGSDGRIPRPVHPHHRFIAPHAGQVRALPPAVVPCPLRQPGNLFFLDAVPVPADDGLDHPVFRPERYRQRLKRLRHAFLFRKYFIRQPLGLAFIGHAVHSAPALVHVEVVRDYRPFLGSSRDASQLFSAFTFLKAHRTAVPDLLCQSGDAAAL